MSAPPSKRSGREPGFSTGRPIQSGCLAGVEERLAAVGVVEEHAEARAAVGDLRRRLDGEALEVGKLLARRAGIVGELLQLRAMIDGEREERLRLRPAASSPNAYG